VEGSLGIVAGSLYEDSMQNLWVGVPNGFWRWKPGPPKFFSASTDALGVVAFGEDDQHALLVALKGGVHPFVNGQIARHPLPYPGLSNSLIRIFRDRDGGLWFGTLDHGLIHVHQGKAESFSSSDGLSGDSVFSFFEDREGDVWVTTSGGIDKFRSYSVPTISNKQGLNNALVLSAMAARDGRVWIASFGGLYIWDHGRVSAFRTSNRGWKSAGSTGRSVPTIPFEDSSGRIWISAGREFGYFDHDRFVSLSGYSGGNVRAIVEGPPGHLWVSSPESGLFEVFQGKVVQQFSWRELGLEHSEIALAVDPAASGLWLGLWNGGIAHFAANKIQASWTAADGLGQGNVNDLRLDSRGTLWAATNGGLSRIKNGRISTLTSRNGLPCDAVYWSVEDGDDAVWLYMPCGLVRVAKGQMDAWAADAKSIIEMRVLDASDGVGTPPLNAVYGGNGPLVTQRGDRTIWFVTADGVSTIDPHHLHLNSVVPPVRIDRIVANGKPYNPEASLRLQPLVHYLAIDYTALSLAVPEKVRFRYKLEGVDPGWREVINDREVQYSNLSPGHYRFRVIAANNNGVWNYEGDTVDFDILPDWYQTVWFYAACTAFTLLLLWWAHLLRVRHLRNQERKLRDVVDTIPTFVWTALPDGSVDFVNHHWEEFSGLSAEQTAGSGWLEALHPEDRNRHAEKWGASVSTGEPFEIEGRFRRTNGEYSWFLVRAVPMRESHGKITKWFGTTTDIEDRKRSELLRTELAHVNRITTMGELLASISHELKQPITATVLNAGTALHWLKHDPPNMAAVSELTNQIIKSGKLAGEIIDRLRALYKKIPPKREPVIVNDVIGELIGMIRAEATGHAVSLRADLADNLPPVIADRVQLLQVLMNLMLNGIEAMCETGGVLTIKSKLSEDGQIQISVHDTGSGLPLGETDRIFEAFFTTKPQGSGMGLAICKSIVESHGGRIWANGNGGLGATFHFTLPTASGEGE
jgi:PAS domain S-box-containing protein